MIVNSTKLYIFFLIFVFTISVGAQTKFDVISYNAEIEPDLVTKSVNGAVVVRFTPLIDNLTEIQLNAGVLEIDGVREDKISLKFEKKDSILRITLTQPAKLNEKREIEITYHGMPKFGVKFYPEQSQGYTIFSTSQWMPCIDSPDDRAMFRLNLIAPKGSTVVGNGRFVKNSDLPNNKISSIWEQKNPIPTYLFGFVFGQFREVSQNHKGVKLRYLAPMQLTEKEIKEIFHDTADMLDFYEDKAGMKYADRVYTQVIPVGDAQQEMSSFTALSENYGRNVIKNKRDIWLGAHEFAHQWWGNMVTNNAWTHFWLNEGITNFMTAAYFEHRFDRAKYLAQIEVYRAAYETVRLAGKDKSLVFPDWTNPSGQDRRLVYNKGAYVTHLLREELGDAAFWEGLKEYTKKYWGKSVTTVDFQMAMEDSSGKDLADFFNKWIYLRQ